jgi:AraC family transcriptional regulator
MSVGFLMRLRPTNESIVEGALRAAPKALADIPRAGLRVARWEDVFCGRYELPPFPDPLLVVHLGGTPKIRIREGERWSRRGSTPGTVTYFPEAAPRTGWLANGEIDVVTISIGRRSPMRGTIDAARRHLEVGVSDALTVALMRSIGRTLDTFDEKDEQGRRYLESMSETLLLHFADGERARRSSRTLPPGPPSPLLRIADYIERHCTEDLRVDALAAEAGLSPAYFSELFKRTIGLSPHRYLLRARIERAREALSLTNVDLASIALELGFSSQSHLTAVFRKQVGVTPAEYRRTTAGDS